MLTKIVLQVIVSVLNTFFSPRNIKDRKKFIAIKLINSFAMILLLSYSSANLMHMKEILSGEHEQLFNPNINLLYYIYLSLLILISAIISILGLLLFLRRHHARRIFLIVYPALIVLVTIKLYFIGLNHFEVEGEIFAVLYILIALIPRIGIYVFMLLKKTKEYFESATIDNSIKNYNP